MSTDDAIAYIDLNVGHEAFPVVNEQSVYIYVNVGDFGVRSVLGRITELLRPEWSGLYHIYVNVLEQISGDLRRLEDGTPRHLEDGTERTLE